MYDFFHPVNAKGIHDTMKSQYIKGEDDWFSKLKYFRNDRYKSAQIHTLSQHLGNEVHIYPVHKPNVRGPKAHGFSVS